MVEGLAKTNRGAPTRIYRFLRAGARLALRVFYRHIQVTGTEHLAAHAPTILASTHPNSIVDPLLVGLFESRQVTFCARDGLFRIPVLGRLMRAVGAIPIQRRSDHAGPVDNSQTFAACREVLAGGGVISIFPEGKTHARMRVEPLKTGTARMAIDAEREAGPLGLVIIPVGLNYLVREAFRSDVHVAFGPPIPVAATVAALTEDDPSLGDDPRALVRALTERVRTAIEALTIHIERQGDERLIAKVTQIVADIRQAEGLDRDGQSPAERTALARRVIDAYRWLETRDPIRCARLRTWINAYLDERRSLGVGDPIDNALQARREGHHGREDRSVFGLVGLILGAPIAALGVLTGALPYLLLRVLLLLVRPTTDRIALTKLLGGTVLFGAMFVGVGVAAMEFVRPSVALGVSVSLVPVLIFSHRYLIDLRLYRFGLSRNLRWLWQRSRYLRLELERQLIQRELGELRRAYLAEHPHIEPIAPPLPPPDPLDPRP